MAMTSRHRACTLSTFVVALLLAALAGRGMAQPPKPGTPPADPEAAAAAARAAKQLADVKAADLFKRKMAQTRLKFSSSGRAGEIAEGEKASVEEYYAMWTELFQMPGTQIELPDLRDKIKRETKVWGNATEKKKGLDFVNNVLLTKMFELAGDGKAPILARYNAMLVIGDLNDVESNSLGTTPTTPMAAAAPVLLKVVADPAAVDAIKVAALVGLLRHVEVGIADKKVEKQLQDEMLKLLAEEQTPEGRSTDGHLWLRRRAMEILARVIKPGPGADNQKFTAELKKILSDKDMTMIVRCEAAVALGRIGAADPELVPALAGLIVDITQQEPTRRGIRTYLTAVNVSLNGQDPIPGFAKSLPAAQKKSADELAEMLKEIFKVLEIIGDNEPVIPVRMPEEGMKVQDWLARNYNVQPAAQPAAP